MATQVTVVSHAALACAVELNSTGSSSNVQTLQFSDLPLCARRATTRLGETIRLGKSLPYFPTCFLGEATS
jgi:hypothetical protein